MRGDAALNESFHWAPGRIVGDAEIVDHAAYYGVRGAQAAAFRGRTISVQNAENYVYLIGALQ